MIRTSLKWTVEEEGGQISISANCKEKLIPCLENHKQIVNRMSNVWSRRGSWETSSTKR